MLPSWEKLPTLRQLCLSLLYHKQCWHLGFLQSFEKQRESNWWLRQHQCCWSCIFQVGNLQHPHGQHQLQYLQGLLQGIAIQLFEACLGTTEELLHMQNQTVVILFVCRSINCILDVFFLIFGSDVHCFDTSGTMFDSQHSVWRRQIGRSLRLGKNILLLLKTKEFFCCQRRCQRRLVAVFLT